MSAEKPATHCGRCAAPLPLPFQNAEIKDLCVRCAWNYYHRTGLMSTGIVAPYPTCPFPFARAAAAVEKKKPAPAVGEEEKKHAAPPGRCAACRKKVGLLGFACRCGGAFCGAHRHAESHGCDFDYKEHGRKRIATENPVVVAPKVPKISTR